jgi:transposase-like protein
MDMVTWVVYIYLRSLSLNKTVDIVRSFYEESVLCKKRVLEFIENLADRLPSNKKITEKFRPQRSGYYAVDGTWFKYRGHDIVIIICFDVKTLDVVDYKIYKSESYEAYNKLFLSCYNEISQAKGFFFDGSPGLLKSLNELFPKAPKQLCVFHKEKRCSQIVPFQRVSEEDKPLKRYVNEILYASSEQEAREKLLDFSLYVKTNGDNKKARELLGALKRNFEYLLTHFSHEEMSAYNNVLEGFNAIINTKINLMKGFKKPVNVGRFLKVIIADYRLHEIKESKFKERNGKSPLELSGCTLPKIYNTMSFLLNTFNA